MGASVRGAPGQCLELGLGRQSGEHDGRCQRLCGLPPEQNATTWGGGTSTNRSVFSHRSGGQTSKSQVWAGPLSIPGSGHSPSLPLPPFFLLVGSLARSDVTPICLCGHTPSPLWVPMSSPGASPAHVSLLLLQGHPLHGVEGPPSSRVISSSPVTSATIRFPIRSHSGVLGVRT